MSSGFRDFEVLRAVPSGVVENRNLALCGRYGRRDVEDVLFHFNGIGFRVEVADCSGFVASGGSEQVGSTAMLVAHRARASVPRSPDARRHSLHPGSRFDPA
ncbi:MAG: hypothetical protein OXI87_13200 [Albidovulum sp.]|nr:hypothetical protein [Albidovulum sp.]MDE0305815.1 hypothetical protein [Albidovulum sp.]MDE0534389.1 hypothetical protein [Albidovulum sp.]